MLLDTMVNVTGLENMIDVTGDHEDVTGEHEDVTGEHGDVTGEHEDVTGEYEDVIVKHECYWRTLVDGRTRLR